MIVTLPRNHSARPQPIRERMSAFIVPAHLRKGRDLKVKAVSKCTHCVVPVSTRLWTIAA
jgi:hypothetical protein